MNPYQNALNQAGVGAAPAKYENIATAPPVESVSVLSDVIKQQSAELCARLRTIADRLHGSVPQADQEKTNPNMTVSVIEEMRTISRMLNQAHEEVLRIERNL